MYGFIRWRVFTSLFAKIPDDAFILKSVLYGTAVHICTVARIFILHPVHKCYLREIFNHERVSERSSTE